MARERTSKSGAVTLETNEDLHGACSFPFRVPNPLHPLRSLFLEAASLHKWHTAPDNAPTIGHPMQRPLCPVLSALSSME